MATVWKARLESVQEIDGRAVIDVTIIKQVNTDPIVTWPYHLEYADAGLMTIAQVQADVTNQAKTLASKGTAIDLLKTKIGQVFTLVMT